MNFRGKLQIHLLASLLVFAALPLPARADLPAPDTIYSSNIPVLNQGDEERRRALREGFLQVLVRASGQSSVAANATVQQALSSIEKHLVEFSYSPISEADKAGLKAALEAEQKRLVRNKSQARLLPVQVPTHRIQARFAPDAVRGLLDRAGLPFLPSRRPSVLVWVAVDDGQGVNLLSRFPVEQKGFRDEAQRRGVSLVWPMQDLTDQVALPPQRLMALEEMAVRDASARYSEATILAGRLKQVADGEWQGSWLVLTADGAVTFEVSAEDLSSLLVAGVDASMQQLLRRYAIPPQSPIESVLLQVDAINNLPRYAELLRLLQNIESVRAAAVTDVNGQSVQINVSTVGGSAVFKNLLALESRLQPLVPPGSSEAVAVDPVAPLVLRYRLGESVIQ